jgi:hypothetical protein
MGLKLYSTVIHMGFEDDSNNSNEICLYIANGHFVKGKHLYLYTAAQKLIISFGIR